METASTLFCSKVTPFSYGLHRNVSVFSFRPFGKHLDSKLCVKNSTNNFKFPVLSTSKNSSVPNLSRRGVGSRLFLECSTHSNAATGTDSDNHLVNSLKNVSWESLKSTLLKVTPLDICKWSLVFAFAIAASKWSLNVLFSPFLWMYISWTWLFWPWIVVVSMAVYAIYCMRKYLRGDANSFEQFAIITTSFTWLTLVPPAYFNGFLEGWPFVFFFVYHYFFFLNFSVRKRLYGDVYPRQHDPKWDITLPNWQKVLFCAGVTVAHWLAAFEAPELHLIPGGFSCMSIWVFIMLSLFMQYHSTFYLAKYSEKVVVPTAVVCFGPYRFVRHPIYASTMLLFVTYFTSLRAPISVLFVVALCLMYYGQKARVEEAVMLETFGEQYTEYTEKVKYKLIPFIY